MKIILILCSVLELERLFLEDGIECARRRMGLGFRNLGLHGLGTKEMAVRDMDRNIDWGQTEGVCG